MDPFEQLTEQLAVTDAFERDRVIHWADVLFRDMVLERKATLGLVSETAERRARRSMPARGVLIVDMMACGGSIHVVDLLRRVLGGAGEIAYVGLGVPLVGVRDLIARGLEDLVRRHAGPPVRCAFHSASLFDLLRPGGSWEEIASGFDWVLVCALDGRISRRAGGPLEPADLSRLGFAHSAVISFLDPDGIGHELPVLCLLAQSLGQPLELRFEVLREGLMEELGSVEVPPEMQMERARRSALGLLDSASRFAHRVRIRPTGALSSAGEVVELHSAGLVRDHLFAGQDIGRFVPAGGVRVAIVDSST